MSTEIASLYATIGADTSAFQNALKGVGSQLSGASDALKQFGAAATAGLTLPIVGGLLAAVKAASDSETVLTQLNAVLKSTHGTAGVTAEKATELANSLQKVTRFGDETVMSAENMLLTFTNIHSNVFPQVTEMALDMSQALGQDVKSSAMQLGKALNDPIKGISALQRVGVAFTESQKNMIETLTLAGRTEEAQAIILKELQTEFGGSARAAGETFAGKLDILKNTFDNLLEVIGAQMLPMLTGLVQGLTGFVEQLSQTDPQLLQFGIVIAAAAAAIGPLAALLGFILSPIGALAAAAGLLFAAFQTNFGGIRDVVMGLWNDIQGPLASIKNAVDQFMNNLGKAGGGAAEKNVAYHAKGMIPQGGADSDAVATMTAAPATMNSTKDIGDRIVTAIKGVIPQVIEALGQLVNSMTAWLAETGGMLIGKAIRGLIDLPAAIETLVASGDLQTAILNMLTAVGTLLDTMGTGLVKGALEGLFGFTPEQAAKVVGEMKKNIQEQFVKLFGDGSDFQKTVSGIVTTIGNLWLGLSGIVSGVFNGVVQSIKDAIATVLDFIADVVSKLSGVPMIGDKFGGVADNLRGAAAQLRGKATGGLIDSATTYLVGEKGPELFTSSTAGRIIPNDALGGAMGGGGGAVININNPTFTGVQDISGFYDALQAEAGRRNMQIGVARR